MTKILWKSLLATPALLGVALASSSVLANEAPVSNLQEYNSAVANSSLDQVTSVSQLSDVQPTDWAFQALQSLVERYGVIAGYPDGKFRGNRAMTRYEFAAGLNAALDRVNELIAAGTADLVSKEDLATLQKLQEEFSAELATLRGRVDALEARTATLEAQQFSTTTKLNGEVIFALSDVLGGELPGTSSNNTVLQDRVRLNFDTSFTGRDRLRTRLQAGNFGGNAFTNLAAGNQATLGFASGTDNTFTLDELYYRFPLSPKTNVILAANAVALDVVTDPVSPFSSSGEGAISRFGRFSPIYRLGGAGAGIAVQHGLADGVRLDLAYISGSNAAGTISAANPGENSGVFNGNYAGMAQLNFTPSKDLKLALTYVNAYNVNNLGQATGSTSANVPGGKVSSNSYGLEANYRLSAGFQLGGWVGFTQARALGGASARAVGGDVDIFNYAVTLAFPDLGGKGNLGGIVFGMQPKVTNTTIAGTVADPSSGLHIEGFYRYRLNNNISITPGIIWLTAPNHNETATGNSNDVFIGTIRTTFTF